MQKLQVTIADVVNLTPAFKRYLNEPERYQLTPEAERYAEDNHRELMDRLVKADGGK